MKLVIGKAWFPSERQSPTDATPATLRAWVSANVEHCTVCTFSPVVIDVWCGSWPSENNVLEERWDAMYESVWLRGANGDTPLLGIGPPADWFRHFQLGALYARGEFDKFIIDGIPDGWPDSHKV
jgi:hypothetical protein